MWGGSHILFLGIVHVLRQHVWGGGLSKNADAGISDKNADNANTWNWMGGKIEA